MMSAKQHDSDGARLGSRTDPQADQSARTDRVERFKVIYDDTYDDLWKYCVRRSPTPHEAEDALGQVFAVAWRRLDDIPTGDGTRPWLFGVARNQLRSSRRRRLRITETIERLRSTRPAVVNHFNAPSDGSEIRQALDALSDADREVLRLIAWEELSHAEAAAVLGCSENAVAIRVHRARDRFKKELAKLKGYDPSAQAQGEGDSGK